MSKQIYQKAGLIIALAIAGFTLPTSIMSMMETPTTPTTVVNNYYYNTTIVEQYNTTIIEQYNTTIIEQYNSTIVEQYNNTIIYNNTVYGFTNQTIEFYHFTNVADGANFLNLSYSITEVCLIIIYETFILNYNYHPSITIYRDSLKLLDDIEVYRILPLIWESGFYELEFRNNVPPPNSNFSICINILS